MSVPVFPHLFCWFSVFLSPLFGVSIVHLYPYLIFILSIFLREEKHCWDAEDGSKESLHPVVHGVFQADDYELLHKPLEEKRITLLMFFLRSLLILSQILLFHIIMLLLLVDLVLWMIN